MQSKFWRFNINNQNQGSGTTGSSSSSGTTGQNQSGQAYLIVESNDQQSAVEQARQLLGTSQSSNLGTPTEVDQNTVQQFQSGQSSRSTQTA
jgi:hypothetical protein